MDVVGGDTIAVNLVLCRAVGSNLFCQSAVSTVHLKAISF